MIHLLMKNTKKILFKKNLKNKEKIELLSKIKKIIIFKSIKRLLINY